MTAFNQLLEATQEAQQELLKLPFVQRGIAGEWSLEEYQAFLGQAFHHVKHTVPLLMAAGSRFSYEQEWLREAMAEYIEEELGHQKWILNDIKNSGGNEKLAEQSRPDMACEMLVAYAYDSIERISPLAFLGMVHVLEGTSVRAATQASEALGKNLGLAKNCFSYLSSHGCLDIEHIDFFASLINKITDEAELELITHHSLNFFKLYGNIFRDLQEQFHPQSEGERHVHCA